jgi:hypothetical protein
MKKLILFLALGTACAALAQSTNAPLTYWQVLDRRQGQD